jgi:phospholipid/cholesterol/gamma-HCH transport system ATP-binding protein
MNAAQKQAVETTAETPLVRLDQLHVEFGRQHVLRDINLSIRRGQTVVVIGESGCGKTVLLKTIIGLVRPTRGHVEFKGRDIHHLSERELTALRTRFGFVFQQAALFDSLTIGQNVAFPLKQHRQMSSQEIEQTVRQALADVGLPESVIYKWPAELSGGMRKRVGLARALVMNPELMLYDEPTTGLDPIMSDVINELILRTQQRSHVTSIVITHDMHTARKVADRVIMVYPLTRLAPGESQVLFDGHPEELDACRDRRVQQFIRGEAGERLTEMQYDLSAG